MHFPALRILSIVASLGMLSRAYSDDVFGAREYIDELSTRTDAVLFSLSTRELIAELSDRLDRRKDEPLNVRWQCTLCGRGKYMGPQKVKECDKSPDGFHRWAQVNGRPPAKVVQV
ncbi:hypothetical protein DFP72DRAFT_1083251 [Ephemerocybe angulata]|uniref:Uncharacterized protein n=1 Tax=Ephemerocybe angulata TaxID=980116 RepID=A0A8H6LUW5_9AGAR|nr:hypothetical protein DFP72DRAFT_1083251 [Tulosesus angulatus]